MTYAPDIEGTTGTLPIIVPTPGRRRSDTAAPYGPPAWLPFSLTLTAVLSAIFAIYVFRAYPAEPASPLLMAVAAVYLVVAFGFDVLAAVRAKRTGQ